MDPTGPQFPREWSITEIPNPYPLNETEGKEFWVNMPEAHEGFYGLSYPVRIEALLRNQHYSWPKSIRLLVGQQQLQYLEQLPPNLTYSLPWELNSYTEAAKIASSYWTITPQTYGRDGILLLGDLHSLRDITWPSWCFKESGQLKICVWNDHERIAMFMRDKFNRPFELIDLKELVQRHCLLKGIRLWEPFHPKYSQTIYSHLLLTRGMLWSPPTNDFPCARAQIIAENFCYTISIVTNDKRELYEQNQT